MVTPLLRTRSLLFATLALAPALAAPVAQADEAAMSRFHYEQAERFYGAGRYERAVHHFFMAQRLSPNPRTLYNIGLCFLPLRRHADAFHFLSEYLGQQDDAPGATERRRFAQSAIERLAPRIARVHVTSEPPGAEIYVDQREHGIWGTTPRLLALPPGERRIWVELEGHEPSDVTITAERGALHEVGLEPQRILGTIQITSPLDASVRLVDARGELAFEGRVPVESQVAPGRYEVEVTAEGYRSYRRLIVVAPEATTALQAHLERVPPPTGSLAVTANVSEAVVELDGEPAGFTPLAVTGLAVREHEVRVIAPERVPWSGTVDIGAERETWLRVKLEQEPQGRSPLTWVLGGLGIALVGAGITTGRFAISAHDDFQARYGTLEAGDLQDERRKGRALGVTTDVLLSFGLASLVTGVLLYFVTDDSGERRSTATISGTD